MENVINTVEAGNVTMDYYRFGSGEKTMVILPGLSVQSVLNAADDIAAAYDIFTKDFTVYVFDRRKNLPDVYSVNDMADDTALVMKKLGLENVYLFGASQGGMMAFLITAKYPELVRKATVASTTLGLSKSAAPAVSEWVKKAAAGDKIGLYTAFAKTVYPEEIFRQYEGLIPAAAAGVTDNDLKRFVILARAVSGYTMKDRVGDIHCPLFVVASKSDRIFGEDVLNDMLDSFGGLPGFEYHIYEGYGHALYDTAPDFKQKMYDFFVK